MAEADASSSRKRPGPDAAGGVGPELPARHESAARAGKSEPVKRTSCEAPGAVAEPDGGAWLPPIRRAVQCLISERVRAVSSFGEGACSV